MRSRTVVSSEFTHPGGYPPLTSMGISCAFAQKRSTRDHRCTTTTAGPSLPRHPCVGRIHGATDWEARWTSSGPTVDSRSGRIELYIAIGPEQCLRSQNYLLATITSPCPTPGLELAISGRIFQPSVFLAAATQWAS